MPEAARGCVENNFAVFLDNHPAELDGYLEIAEVVSERLLSAPAEKQPATSTSRLKELALAAAGIGESDYFELAGGLATTLPASPTRAGEGLR
jgi:uncharacterized membrane protein